MQNDHDRCRKQKGEQKNSVRIGCKQVHFYCKLYNCIVKNGLKLESNAEARLCSSWYLMTEYIFFFDCINDTAFAEYQFAGHVSFI